MRNYDRAFKCKIARLITQGSEITEVAKLHGISPCLCRRWYLEFTTYGSDAFPGKGNKRIRSTTLHTQQFTLHVEVKVSL